MRIELDPLQAVPLYLQIVQTVRDQIAKGDLAPGAALPTIRELAARLSVNQNTVSRAYAILHQEGLIEGHGSQGTHVAPHVRGAHLQAAREAQLRLLTTRYIGESLSHGFRLPEIESAFVSQRARWQEQQPPSAGRAAEASNPILGMGSHDLCLELLLARLRSRHPERCVSFAVVGSLAGLMALARGEVHFAAAHLYDAAANDCNAPLLRQLTPRRRCALLTLSHRTQGLLVAKGNPRGIVGLRDLAKPGTRFVNRQRGSGTRVLLDGLLREARLAPQRVNGYDREEQTHVAVAAAIAGGAADVGLGIQAAAFSFDLDFVPLAQERFEIVLLRDEPLISLFSDVVAQPEFRQAAQSLGGYDLTETGCLRYV